MNGTGEVYLTRYYREIPAPGLPKGDRIKRKLIEVCEAIDRDIESQGAVSYETVEQVRAVLALARLP